MLEAARDVQRVLVVEDNATLRSAVCRALRTGGRVIEEASTCEEAVAALKHGCDLLLLDVRLPGFDPASLMRELAAFGTTKTDGTGLGLYTAERLVVASGGQLLRANRPEGGAVVRVVLAKGGIA